MNFAGLLLVFAVISIFGFAMYWSLQSAKRSLRERRNQVLQLGFQPLENLPTGLEEKLVSLHQKTGHQKFRFENLYVRQAMDYKIYMYDLWDDAGNDRDIISYGALAVESPYLTMPKFTLVPRITQQGKFASLVNVFISKLASRHGQKIEFGDHLEFNKRYFVLGSNEKDITCFFNRNKLNELSRSEYLMIDGQDKLFIVDRFEFNGRGSTLKSKQPFNVTRIDEAVNIFKILHEN